MTIHVGGVRGIRHKIEYSYVISPLPFQLTALLIIDRIIDLMHNH